MHTVVVLLAAVTLPGCASFPFGPHATKRDPSFNHGLMVELDNRLSTLEATSCPNTGLTAPWQFYCHDSGAVLPCPLDERLTFYEKRCKTALVVHRIKTHLLTDVSPAAVVEGVGRILDEVSGGRCGGSGCRRDEVVCYQGINVGSNQPCRPAAEICGRDDYRMLCLKEAHLYLVTASVLDYFRRTSFSTTPAATRTTPPVSTDPTVTGPTPPDHHIPRWIIIVVAVASSLLFAASTVIGTCVAIHRWKRKKPADRPQDQSSEDGERQPLQTHLTDQAARQQPSVAGSAERQPPVVDQQVPATPAAPHRPNGTKERTPHDLSALPLLGPPAGP